MSTGVLDDVVGVQGKPWKAWHVGVLAGLLVLDVMAISYIMLWL